jgi:hypothetical protein
LVLHKVDGNTSAAWRTVINSRWAERQRRKPEPQILWEFIEQQRDNVLRAYTFSVQGKVTAGTPPGSIGMISSPLGTSYAPPARFDVLLADGPFKGQPPFEVVQQAIAFWRGYLDDVEGAVT